MIRHITSATAILLAVAISGPGNAADSIKIGAPILLSGPGAFVGGAQKKTFEMLAEEVNQAGGINGRQVEFIFYDTEAKPDVAVRLVKRLIKKDQVDAILGISASWAALPVLPIIEKAKVPTVALASASSIVNPVKNWVFKAPAGDLIVASKLLSHMNSMNLKKLALVTTQDGFGSGGHTAVVALAGKHGIEIVFDDKYTMDDTDITPMLNRIKKTDADAVLNWSSRRAPVIMTMNYRQMGLKLPLFHSHASLSRGFLKAAGKNADGIIVSAAKFYGSELLPDSDVQKKVIQGYRDRYQAKWGEPANQFGAAAFDAFNILVGALRVAGTDNEKLRAAIESTSKYVGIGGVYEFSASDHGGLTRDSLVMYQAVGGEWKLMK